MNSRDMVVDYHERTKHHPHRYARSLGYLDWATQPDPFRRFDGAELIALPPLDQDDTPAYDAMYDPAGVAPSPLTDRSLSRFFDGSLALSAWKVYGESRWALRVNPSSGNLHPTEGYAVLGPIQGVADTPGVYHYAPKEHAIEQRTTFDPDTWRALMAPLPEASFLAGLSSVIWRETWKYGERAFRYCQHDVGHALGALRLAAAMLGWRLVLLEVAGDAEVAALLGLDRDEDFAGAEREEPDLIAAVFPNRYGGKVPTGLDPDVLARISAGTWYGRANALSPDHVEWPIIDRAAEATTKPLTSHLTAPSPRTPDRPDPAGADSAQARPNTPAPSARCIIRRRRSAVAFDGRTRIGADVLYRILSRVMLQAPKGDGRMDDPRETGCGGDGYRAIPWDVWSWSARIHLLIFVHRVEPLPPGLYCLLRDPAQAEPVRRAMNDRFRWETPAGCPSVLPLFLLTPMDCRAVAARLSLGQDIAGDGALSLGMIADFERSITEFGPWFYRRLFWEAGLVGQVLYLEAEAAGVRATGIGAYFDDEVHKFAGLKDSAFQSLYHFTLGGPVHDSRLSTQPAYPWSPDPPDPHAP